MTTGTPAATRVPAQKVRRLTHQDLSMSTLVPHLSTAITLAYVHRTGAGRRSTGSRGPPPRGQRGGPDPSATRARVSRIRCPRRPPDRRVDVAAAPGGGHGRRGACGGPDRGGPGHRGAASLTRPATGREPSRRGGAQGHGWAPAAGARSPAWLGLVSGSFVSNHDLNGLAGVIPPFQCGAAGAANTIHSLDRWCLARSSPPDGSNDACTHACRRRRRYTRPPHGRDSCPGAGGQAYGTRHRRFSAPGLAAAGIRGSRTYGAFTYCLPANRGLAGRLSQ